VSTELNATRSSAPSEAEQSSTPREGSEGPETRVAVVTGAGTGIGRGVAIALLRHGYRVALVGRMPDPLRRAAESSGAPATRYLIEPADVTNPDEVEAVFARIAEEYGRCDLLFNNAGKFGAMVPIEDVPHAEWLSVLNVNVTGAFLCTQSAIRMMKRQRPQGGRIINNGSVSAQVPRPNSAPYSASKHALTGLTKCTALDGRPYNIACGQIDIGNALTNLTQSLDTGVPQANGSVAPEPRIDLEHVTEAVLYMANLPLSANVLFMTVMATAMPFVGRG
jgi:NAD(P)-dependent dehydrogenase (short-subunit alcohol dehydrogenase family)